MKKMGSGFDNCCSGDSHLQKILQNLFKLFDFIQD